MFHELLSRDREDGSGTEPDECGSRIADLRIKLEEMSLMNGYVFPP
jgi:hypothetical protein